MKPRLRAQRGKALLPKDPHSIKDIAPEEWISIPVPPLVDTGLFESVQEQLEENRKRLRTSKRGARYLLQGLLVCGSCGYAFYFTVNLSVPAPEKGMRESMRTTAASAAMPIGLEESGFVTISNFELIWWI